MLGINFTSTLLPPSSLSLSLALSLSLSLSRSLSLSISLSFSREKGATLFSLAPRYDSRAKNIAGCGIFLFYPPSNPPPDPRCGYFFRRILSLCFLSFNIADNVRAFVGRADYARAERRIYVRAAASHGFSLRTISHEAALARLFNRDA